MINDDVLEDIRARIAEREELGIRGLAERLGPADWADIVPRLNEDEIAALLEILPDSEISELLGELEPEQAADILETLETDQAADLLEQIDPDDATDIVAELSSEDAEQILQAMEPAEAAEIRELLPYAQDTAGGRMTPAFVAIAPDIRADDAIAMLRRVAEEAETIYYVYVLDPQEKLLGVLSLHHLVLTRPSTPVGDLMVADPLRVQAEADQETAARLLVDNNLLALPVVDDQDRLLGIITQDDIADVLEEEATEDIERLGGSQPLEMPYRVASVPVLVRRRVGWLLFLFLAGLMTTQVLVSFQSRLELVPALTLFIPLIVGIGGNVGSQTATTLVRAIGIGEVDIRDAGWVMLKELATGLLIGLILGLAGLLRGGLAAGLQIGIVVALTILVLTIWSSGVAAVLPLILRKIGFDPAVVSAPFIATLVDATGLLIYLTIAGLVLGAL